MAQTFMDMFTLVGDALALQYGGSETNKRVAASSSASGGEGAGAGAGKGRALASAAEGGGGGGGGSGSGTGVNKHRELLTSVRRYYSNAFTDRAKQDAMNLFLGTCVLAKWSLVLVLVLALWALAFVCDRE